MIFNRNSKDISYTSDGDFMLNSNKGIQLSGMSSLEVLGERIYRRLSSSYGDWASEYIVFSDIRSMVGENLTPTNVDFIKELIRRALTSYGLLESSEINISPAVVSGTSVNISVSVSIDYENKINLAVVYDTRGNDFTVKFLDEKAVR